MSHEVKEGLDYVIAQETAAVDMGLIKEGDAKADAVAADRAWPENCIPGAYKVIRENGGKIERITYVSKAYYGNGEDVEKVANVYLPTRMRQSINSIWNGQNRRFRLLLISIIILPCAIFDRTMIEQLRRQLPGP